MEFHRRPPPRATAVRWCKQWVPQDLAASGGRCLLYKWVTEGTSKSIDQKFGESVEERKPEPTTEVLFLCSFEGCGKTFIDVGALKKHAHVHGERQHVCQYEGCGKKFLDSSKLKRHYLIHTGAREHLCPHEGCGKAFSLDFNLKAHMKTHSLENYHICPHPECGKKFTVESKLKSHMKSHHEKNTAVEVMKHTPPVEKPHSTPKVAPTLTYGPTPERPFACPYEGCGKAYIHEYKLNLHLRREHPGHNPEEKLPGLDLAVDGAGDQDVYIAKGGTAKSLKRSKPNLTSKMPPAKVANKKDTALAPTNMNIVQKNWLRKDAYEEDRDSEETEEDQDDIEEDGWRYRQMNGDDESEDED